MKRFGILSVLTLFLGGCLSTEEEQVRRYNENGLQLYRQNNFIGARDYFQASLNIQPEDPDIIYDLAQCYEHLGNPMQAEQLYNESLRRSPNHADCRHSLATLLVRQGRREDAVRMVADWVTHEPKLSAAVAEDGWMWHQRGDLPRAQRRLQEALELDPHNTRALNELALLYEELQRPDRSLVLYERSFAQDPLQLDVKQRLDFLVSRGVTRPRPD